MQCETRGYLPEAHNFGGQGKHLNCIFWHNHILKKSKIDKNEMLITFNFFTDECNLYCRGSQSNFFYYRGSVDDGTHCNKDNGACVNNVCVAMSFKPGKFIFKLFPIIVCLGPYLKLLTLTFCSRNNNRR